MMHNNDSVFQVRSDSLIIFMPDRKRSVQMKMLQPDICPDRRTHVCMLTLSVFATSSTSMELNQSVAIACA